MRSAVSKDRSSLSKEESELDFMCYFLLLLCLVLWEDNSLLPTANQPTAVSRTRLVHLHAGGYTTRNVQHTWLETCFRRAEDAADALPPASSQGLPTDN